MYGSGGPDGEPIFDAVADDGGGLCSGSGAVRKYVRSNVKYIPPGSGFF